MAAESRKDEPPAATASPDREALRRGDTDAFAELVRAHHRALLAVARGMVGDGDAEEIVQNAWIKAYQAIAGYEGRAQPRTWLTSIVMNEARMHLRRAARDAAVAVGNAEDLFAGRFDGRGGWREPPAAWSLHGSEDALLGEQFAECLERILDAIPPQQRLVLELRDVQGMSVEAVGAELALSAANVRVLLHRARKRLYQAIERFEVTGRC